MLAETDTKKLTLSNTLARGTAVNLAGFAIRALLTFLHSFVGSRLYGVEAYGIYALGMSIVTMLSVFGRLGFERSIVRFVAVQATRNEPQNAIRVLSIALYITIPVSAGIGIALFFWPNLFAHLFDEPLLASSLRFFSIAVPALTFSTLLTAFFQGRKSMGTKVITQDIVTPTVEVLLLMLLAWLGFQKFGLSVAYSTSLLVSSFLLLYVLWSAIKQHEPRMEQSKQLVMPMLGFAMPALASNLLLSVSQRSSIFILGILGTSSMVGIFSILLRLVALGTRLLFSLNLMFSPLIAELVENQQIDKLAHLYKTSVRWLLMTSFPLFILTIFYQEKILSIFGPEFAINPQILLYLITATMINVATGSSGVILMMSGHPNQNMINEASGLIATTGLSWILIPKYGLLGAAIAYSMAMIISNLLRILQVWWFLNIHPYSWSLTKVFLAGLVMVISLLVIDTYSGLNSAYSWSFILWTSAFTVGIYSFVLIYLGLEIDELQIMQKIYKRMA